MSQEMKSMLCDVQMPLVSIFSMCKDRVHSIRRCIESVLAQDYPNLEFVVQDGASTDGTLEILQDYARQDSRIQLISEPDSGPAEGLFRALKRCRGEIIGSCLSDEELLPSAVRWAVENLAKYPNVAAIYGDVHITDIDGNILSAYHPPSWDIVRYLCQELSPPFSSSFFRRSCLESIGLRERDWSLEVGEFELWSRLGIKFPILYIPEYVSKYGVHATSLSYNPKVYRQYLLSARTKLINQLFEHPELHEIRHLRGRALGNLYLDAAQVFIVNHLFSEAKCLCQTALQYAPHFDTISKIVTQLCQQGIYLLQQENPKEALDYFEWSLPVGLVIQNLNYFRALALFKLGRLDEAKSAVEAELAIQPEHLEAHQLLQELSKLFAHPLKKLQPERPAQLLSIDIEVFRKWIEQISRAQNCFYVPDQTPESLMSLVALVHRCQPTKIVELGTDFGLSLRAWIACDTQADMIAIDGSFKNLHRSQQMLPIDLSKVILLEQDILKTDFSLLWNSQDQVLLYLDVSDELDKVSIMEYVLQEAVPRLPGGSVVVIDDVWYSAITLSKENVQQFFETTVLKEIQYLQCLDAYYVPYWQGGSCFGFQQIIPLMKRVNQNHILLDFEKNMKLVSWRIM